MDKIVFTKRDIWMLLFRAVLGTFAIYFFAAFSLVFSVFFVQGFCGILYIIFSGLLSLIGINLPVWNYG